MLNKEDRIQIALGLKFFCCRCGMVKDKEKYNGNYYKSPICISCEAKLGVKNDYKYVIPLFLS